MSLTYKELLKRAAVHIKSADSLLITSGAGMSVDCGLPDFSGDNGLIKKIKAAYNTDYRNVINPRFFETNPRNFWYIYGDRY